MGSEMCIRDSATWQGLFDEDLHMAQRALAEDNAPGVERALARLEASLIQLNNQTPDEVVMAPDAVVSDGSDRIDLSTEPSTVVVAAIMAETTEEVPFVDLAGNPSSEEE